MSLKPQEPGPIPEETARVAHLFSYSGQPAEAPWRLALVTVRNEDGGIISRFEVVEPSLTDIFMELVGTTALPDAPSAMSSQPRASLNSLQNQVKQGTLDILLVLDTAHRLGLTPAQTTRLFAPPSLTMVYTKPGQSTRPTNQIVAGYVLAFAGALLVYFLLAFFLYTTLYAGLAAMVKVKSQKDDRSHDAVENSEITPRGCQAQHIQKWDK